MPGSSAYRCAVVMRIAAVVFGGYALAVIASLLAAEFISSARAEQARL